MSASSGETTDPPTERFSPPEEANAGKKRKRAVLLSLPFLLLGLGNVVLILSWGLEPLWGFALLPPILFCTVLTYIVFSTDFLEGR
ncbi:hypothetical protein [Natronocalculus amylovorans]|uniref:DUF8142 domain-containing protein n=1 Tax=Natronocalculus amylovorans TaxID=2917812 RepID=A0AAE3FXD1_9EURY|nr:hypothetical protein [Natronocalculus amylovorans]MCL9816951.1 hypothetical protein [Natronocalculus amylovorans]NUE02987.1 hypothetical protein [Halorubraceae archaeon YAN]